MKKIILLLFLVLLTSFQVKQRLIYFDVETRDEAGKIVPNCVLTAESSLDRKAYRFDTDKSGKSFFSLPVTINGKSSITVIIHAFYNTGISYRQFENMQMLKDGDTVRGIVTIYQPKKK